MRDSIDNDYDGHADDHLEGPYSAYPDCVDPESYTPLPPYYRRRRRFWLTDSMAAADPYAGNPVPLE